MSLLYHKKTHYRNVFFILFFYSITYGLLTVPVPFIIDTPVLRAITGRSAGVASSLVTLPETIEPLDATIYMKTTLEALFGDIVQ